MNSHIKQGIRLFAQTISTLALRITFNVIFALPNIEPLYACAALVSRTASYASSFFFGFMNIALFDIVTGAFGWWTLVTGSLYGLIGIAFIAMYKRNNITSSMFHIRFLMIQFTIVATLMYDIITGCLLGPLLYQQPFIEAVIGQIPFSINHVLGNSLFVLCASCIFDDGYQFLRNKLKRHFVQNSF